MFVYQKNFVGSVAVLILLIVGFVYVSLVSPFSLRKAQAAPVRLPYNATANGPYKVVGNKIVGADGKPYIFHGVGRDGLEYNCTGEGPLDVQHLAFIGAARSGGGALPGTYWGANTVRLPLSEGFWLKGVKGWCSAGQYQAKVKQAIDNLTTLKLNVIIDLHWADAAGQAGRGGAPIAMPDADSVTFWKQVASIYKGYSNVLFELYNEPHPGNNWACWVAGCQITNDKVTSNDCNCVKTFAYQGVGMQTLVNTVRSVGANNVVFVGGLNWGYDLSQLPKYQLSGSNIVYDTHPYPYASKMPGDWDRAFGNLTAKYPIISAESGQYDCGTNFEKQLLSYFDAHRMSWIAWAWNSSSASKVCSYPQLITDYQGTPSQQTGQYIYQHLRSYILR